MITKQGILHLDTKWILAKDYTEETIREGHAMIDTPVFDRLAAPVFKAKEYDG